MAYMMSPKQVLVEGQAAHWLPHLMFYFGRSQPASAWGAGDFDAPVIDGTAADPKMPVQIFFVPVRRWSDGTPVMGEGH
jgi:hypothetical protein